METEGPDFKMQITLLASVKFYRETMETMLVEQQYRPGGLRPFEFEMASSSLTPEEKAILQARAQLLGFRPPFPGPNMGMNAAAAAAMGLGMPGTLPSPFGSPPSQGMHPGHGPPHRFDAAATAAAINGSLSQLYAMSAAAAAVTNNGNGSPRLQSPHDNGNRGGGTNNQQVPLPIQLWTQWASLHGLTPLAPTLLAHHAQLAAAISAAANSGNNCSTTTMANGHNSPSNIMDSGMRLQRSVYPSATVTSPLGSSGSSHRFSPYSIPNHNHNPNSARSLQNRSPGSPDSLKEENT